MNSLAKAIAAVVLIFLIAAMGWLIVGGAVVWLWNEANK